MANPTPFQAPTFQQTSDALAQNIAKLLALFAQSRMHKFMVNSIGIVLAKLKLDGTQSEAEITALINTEAQAQVDAIKLAMLKESIVTTQTN